MIHRPVGVVARFRRLGAKFVAVSLIGTVISQSLIVLFKGHWDWNGGVANLVAVCISAVPSYYLNRAWVWGKRGSSSMAREVLPFWIMTLAGLALSTFLAYVADRIWDATIAVNIANLAGFGVLWVLKFLVLDQYVFSDRESV
ncbi:MAG: GtrA family protein [Acidimicrobiales bacterium]